MITFIVAPNVFHMDRYLYNDCLMQTCLRERNCFITMRLVVLCFKDHAIEGHLAWLDVVLGYSTAPCCDITLSDYKLFSFSCSLNSLARHAVWLPGFSPVSTDKICTIFMHGHSQERFSDPLQC